MGPPKGPMIVALTFLSLFHPLFFVGGGDVPKSNSSSVDNFNHSSSTIVPRPNNTTTTTSPPGRREDGSSFPVKLDDARTKWSESSTQSPPHYVTAITPNNHHNSSVIYHQNDEPPPPTFTGGSESKEEEEGHNYNYKYYQRDNSYPSSSSSSSGNINNNNNNYRDSCKMSEGWKGEWFQSGVIDPLSIDLKTISGKGTCIQRSGDKFLFHEKSANCYKCIVINEPHPNVLQYKESPDCEERRRGLDAMCGDIPGDALLFSIFRINAQPEECPFRGAPYTFTYNRGHGECKYPLSAVDACTTPSKLRLRYQACPDVAKTESRIEELLCLAQWKDGGHHFLLGKLSQTGSRSSFLPSSEESFRCFIFERVKTNETDDLFDGFNMAVSGDATCTGVFAPTEGARTLVLTKVVTSKKDTQECSYPSWLWGRSWVTLDGKETLKLANGNSTLVVTQPRSSNSGGTLGSLREGPLFKAGSRLSCLTKREISKKHVALVVKHALGCEQTTLCLHIFLRDKDRAVEVRSSRLEREQEDCFDPSVGGPLTFTTLISADATSSQCPNLGKYVPSPPPPSNAPRVQDQGVLKGCYHNVVVGCGGGTSASTMEIHSKCESSLQPASVGAYQCLSSWDDDEDGGGKMSFLVASPMGPYQRSSSRVCFSYTSSEDRSKGRGGGFVMSSSGESCERNMTKKGEDVWAFNLNIDGQCAEAVRSTASQKFVIPFFFIFSLLIFIPNWCQQQQPS